MRTFSRPLLGTRRFTCLRRSFCIVAASTDQQFKFVSAASDSGSLFDAISECIRTVKQRLGPDHPPHLCQLFVSTSHKQGGIGLAAEVRNAHANL